LRTYWDTSAALNALVSPEVWARLDSGVHFSRVHLFSEVFSTITGRGIPARDQAGRSVRIVLSPSDAVKWLRRFSEKIDLIELTRSEILDALEKAQRLNVAGARVYDYMHAVAADQANTDLLLTRNSVDFSGLTSKARIEWP
jgi:hypothetical protein